MKNLQSQISNLKSQIAVLPTEYLPPANSIDERAERVGAYYHSGRRAAAQLVVYNVLAGIELIGIKEQIAHGEWLKWCEKNLPAGMSHRSANYFMGLAEALIPKLATLANFNFKQLQLTNGELSDQEIKPFAEAVQEVTNGKAYTDLLREYGLMADPKHQKDRPHGAPAKLTAEDRIAQNMAAGHQLANDAHTWFKAPQIHADTPTDLLDIILDALVPVTTLIRQLKRSRRAHKTKRGRTGATPVPVGAPPAGTGPSPAREKIAANARARWAKLRAQEGKK